MKRKFIHTVAAAVGFALCAAASAQAPREEDASDAEYGESIAFADYLGGSDLRASELLGGRVLDESGEQIGEIEDLIVSREDDVVTAVLSIGGFLDVGSKLIGVPYEALRVSPEGDDFYLAMSAEEIEAQPEYQFEGNDSPSLGALPDRPVPGATGNPEPGARAAGEAAEDVVIEQREQREAVSRRTIVAQSEADDRDVVENDTGSAASNDSSRNDSGKSRPVESATGRISEERSSEHRAAAAQSEGGSSSARDADETRRDTRQRAEEIETLRGSDRRASQLIGAKVVTSEGEEVGEIDDLVVSTDQSMQAVLSIGGLLGVGARLVLVPFEALRLQSSRTEEDQSSVRLDMTVDELQSRPIFQYQDTQVSAAEPF